MTTATHHEEAVPAHEHVVVFYEDDDALCRRVAAQLAEAIEAGGAGVAIATEPHRRAIASAVAARGVDVTAEALVLLDAEATLATFMRAGGLDPAAFRRVIGGVLREAAETGGPVRAFGEMVALLWDAGDVMGAIALEEAWNGLADEHAFALLCGYRGSSVAGDEHAEALGHVCRLHSAVVAEPDAAAPSVTGRFAGADAPRAARRLVTDALRRWGLGGRLLEDAQLVISELATNAIRHARSGFSVAVRRTGSGVRLTVRDASPAEPIVRRDPGEPGGRGMLIVSLLATGWGVEAGPEGKTVWVELRA
jgi:MEDS: MEthanogen/methylotroph, DcmR Sensory domain/Histidine kinase-like ATPase domain